MFIVNFLLKTKILERLTTYNSHVMKYFWKENLAHTLLTLHKKWSFPLRISSVHVTKSAVSCGFGHIYWKSPQWETSLFVQCIFLSPIVNEIQVCSFFEPILDWRRHKVESKLERFHKGIIHLKVPSTFDFHLSINIGIRNTNLDIFDSFLGWWHHHGESKLQNFSSPQVSF